jgi:hypothetical protein
MMRRAWGVASGFASRRAWGFVRGFASGGFAKGYVREFAQALAVTLAAVFWLSAAEARYGDDVLVRGEITGVDGKIVILALKRKLVMIPRSSILKKYDVVVGERVVARLPLKMIRLSGNRKK